MSQGKAEQLRLRPEDENRGPEEYRKHQVDEGPGERHANLARCIQAALRLLIEQGNAGDGQQHHAAHANAVARGNHGVTKLMHQHREEHQQHQNEAAQSHLRAVSGLQESTPGRTSAES